ncbi:hypothetical protein [Corynebacterium sp. HMSC30G07]|uniref:hypothetical protein n=1 Tax=Corynebacterium sp. HMSC30G07 TaxID=1581072 RepID=UPI00114D389C|nr:hypothetical protein [Corynebacterium sp. HMSC30G07]
MVICLLLHRSISNRRFAVSVVLEGPDGVVEEVERWPIYPRLGYPAKVIRLAEAGELIAMTEISNTVGNGVLKVAVTNREGEDVDLGELAVLMKIKNSKASFLVRGIDG